MLYKWQFECGLHWKTEKLVALFVLCSEACVFKYLSYSDFYTEAARSAFFIRSHCHTLRLHVFVYCHFVWRTDILLEYQSQLCICLKDYPSSSLCTHCDCHNGKLESDTRAFSVSSAWHSESGRQRHWSSGGWRSRWQRSKRLADGGVSFWHFCITHLVDYHIYWQLIWFYLFFQLLLSYKNILLTLLGTYFSLCINCLIRGGDTI